jgi:ATP-dependent helicase/nuclease subunit A
VTDGEKHFYRRQEIIDVINVLRAIDQPYDAIALAGVLRSLLGGVTDRELVEVCERGALDYRRVDRLVGWDSPNAQVIRELYGRLEWLHRTVPALPLPEALDRVFEALPLLELAAASLHGEQAVANLLKLRQMAEQLAERPHLTFTAFVELLMTRLDEQQEEAESALAEESLDAVRVLTIHKAKGLEFPVVILPGLHQGTGLDPQVAPVSYDWATGVLGLAVGQTKSLGALLTHEKARLREEAECRRLFYVGMTRARERLVLSSGWPARLASGSFLGLLKEAIGEHVGDAAQPFLAIGTGRLAQTVVTVNERPPHRGRKGSSVRLTSSSDWKEVLARWGERDRVWTRVRAQPIHTTPTSHKYAEWVGTQAPHQAAESERHRLVGTLAHRLLAHWDFSRGPERLAERVAAVCRQGLPREWLGHAPDIERELVELFETFFQSEPYGELARATIVGREVPFMLLWEGAGRDPSGEPQGRPGLDAACVTPCVMEGVIDVLYWLDGRFYLADYKTDRVEDGALMTRALAYREQMLIYREAVSRCLGIPDPEVRLIFVRYGQAVSV